MARSRATIKPGFKDGSPEFAQIAPDLPKAIDYSRLPGQVALVSPVKP
jgi:hypothetical protein